MNFTIKQHKKKGVKPRLSLVFIDSIQFLNHLSDNLAKNLGENDFYYLSQEINAKVLDLLKKKGLVSCDN